MAYTIMQGDQYSIPFEIRDRDGNVLTDELVGDVEVVIGRNFGGLRDKAVKKIGKVGIGNAGAVAAVNGIGGRESVGVKLGGKGRAGTEEHDQRKQNAERGIYAAF